MGDETLLHPDLWNAERWSSVPPSSRGLPQPAHDCWQRGNDYTRIPDGGSGNIPKLREAIRYVREPQKYESVARWTHILTQERDNWGFMAFEPFSSIYGDWHLESHLLVFRESVFRGDAGIAQLAAEWLQLYYMAAAFAYTRGHRVASGGMRSAGHMGAAGLREYSVELSLTAPGQPVALPSPPDHIAPYLLKSEERRMLDFFRPQVEQAAARVRAAYPDPDRLAACHVPGWSIQVPAHFLRARDGTAQWCERNCNGNTAPVLAGITWFAGADLARHAAARPEILALAAPAAPEPRDYLALWLPPGGGGRYRSMDDARCTRIGDALSYTSPVWGDHQAPLPCDGAIEYLWQGKTFSKVGGEDPNLLDPAPDPLPDPGPEPSPDPPIDAPDRAELTSIADGIAALQLSRAERLLQAEIVAELNAGLPTCSLAQLADQVAAFGIGAGQSQAAVWQELIARLRSLARRRNV
jgi:hypothetical protein